MSAASWTKLVDRIRRTTRAVARSFALGVHFWIVRHVRRRQLALVLRPAALGDVICLLPAIKAFRALSPRTYVVLATSSPYMQLVEWSGVADKVVQSESEVSRFNPLREKQFDIVFRPTYSDEYSRLDVVEPMHLVYEFASQLNVTLTDPQPRLTVPASDRAAAVQQFGDKRAIPRIAIHAGPTWGIRTWPQPNWDDLVRMLKTDFAARVIQLGDTRIVQSVGHVDIRVADAEDWIGRLSLTETAALLCDCDLLIGIDSGILHLAGAVGTPTVGIFGPTAATRRMPPTTLGGYVQAPVDCVGCHHRRPLVHNQITCPRHVECMQSITALAVFDEVGRVMQLRDLLPTAGDKRLAVIPE